MVVRYGCNLEDIPYLQGVFCSFFVQDKQLLQSTSLQQILGK